MTKIIIKDSSFVNSLTLKYNREDKEKIYKLLPIIKNSLPCMNKLLQLSEKKGVTIDFTKDDLPFQGQWMVAQHTLQVKSNLPFEKTLQTFLFELCNATNDFLSREKLKPFNFESAVAYADYVEMAEHVSFVEAANLYHGLLQTNNNLNIPSEGELRQFQKLYNNETYLDYVKENGHYDHYIKSFIHWEKRQSNRTMGFFMERRERSLRTIPVALQELQISDNQESTNNGTSPIFDF